MATVCVICLLIRKKKFFCLVFRNKLISHGTPTKEYNEKILARIVISLLGSSVYASGCGDGCIQHKNESFENSFIQRKDTGRYQRVQSECKRQHDMGMSVSSINSCNKALDLIAVN